jgi:polysaccharide pyruvyl transferase WcaK-like protein
VSETTLLLGAYGQGNIGDDVILLSILSRLAESCETIYIGGRDLELLTKSLAGYSGRAKLVAFETYGSWIKKIAIILKSSLVIFGGGSLLKEMPRTMAGAGRYSVLLWTTATILLMKALGKQVVALSIGVGPLRSWFGRLLARFSLGGLDQVVLRDLKSYSTCELLVRGKTQKRLTLSVDAFLINAPALLAPKDLPPSSVCESSEQSMIYGLSLANHLRHPYVPSELLPILGSWIASELQSQSSMQLLFFPYQKGFNPRDDAWVFNQYIKPQLSKELMCRVQVLQDISIDNIGSQMARISSMVTMRYHSILICVLTSTPFLAIRYNDKCDALLADLDYPYHLGLDELDHESLSACWREITESEERIRDSLRVTATRLIADGKELRKLFGKML